MQNPRQALLEIAQLLGDDAPGKEFIAYPESLLLQLWNDGLCLLCTLRPDLFSQEHEVELKAGARQELPDGCSTFGQVTGSVAPDGTVTPVTKSSYAVALSWSKPACKANPKDYRVRSYRYDQAQKGVFYVEPPVPPGAKVKVQVVCSSCPDALTIDDLDSIRDMGCYQWVMVKHYVLANVYAMDTDQTNVVLAQFHMGLWNSYLPAAARSQAMFSTPGMSQAVASEPQTRSA